jgi:hypothetical protein
MNDRQLHKFKRGPERRGADRRVIHDPTAYVVDRRLGERREVERRIIRNPDLAPPGT